MNKYIASIQDTYFNKGVEQGIAQGVKSARIELLKSFINKGIINDSNYNDAGLTEEEFNKLKSSKSAETNLF